MTLGSQGDIRVVVKLRLDDIRIVVTLGRDGNPW